MNPRTALQSLLLVTLLLTPAVAMNTPTAPNVDPTQRAFDHLYDALDFPRQTVQAPDPAIAPAVEALAAAVETRAQVFADLDDPDRFWDLLLHAQVPQKERTAVSIENQKWLEDQLDNLDTQPLQDAAQAIIDAVHALPTITISATWIDPSGSIEVGGPGSDCYFVERMLIIETGGDDCYDNYAATGTPWSNLRAPVSIIADLGGNDRYSTGSQHPNHGDSGWSQGVGIGGIGVLFDRWGDDRYDMSLGNQANLCWGYHLQQIYAQGVGVAGVGALIDASGDDRYYTYNANTLQQNCHWNLSYSFVQGVGMDAGFGLLGDDTGHDSYFSYTEERGDDPDNNAHTNAQGVSIGGIGILADKEGDDHYYAGAHASASAASGQKGSHAYVFAQGVNLESAIHPQFNNAGGNCSLDSDMSRLCVPSPCSANKAGVVAADGTSAECELPLGLLADLLGSDSYNIDVSSDSPGYCTVTSRAVGVGQGASGWFGQGILLDADHGVRDSFHANSDARSEGCKASSHLYVQGFAGNLMYDRFDSPYLSFGPASYVHGALLSLGPIEPDGCAMNPPKVRPLGLASGAIDSAVAAATPCNLGSTRTGLVDAYDHYHAFTRATNPIGPADAITYGQGMANKVVPNLDLTRIQIKPPQIKQISLQDLTLQSVLEMAQDLTKYIGAINPGAAASTPGHTMPPIGTLVDLAGHDNYWLQADADAPMPVTDVKGQGAGVNGIGQLYSVGGSDTYDAHAYQYGVPQPWDTHVQAYSYASQPTPLHPANVCMAIAMQPPFGDIEPQCLTNTQDIYAAGILVDVFGQDSYSEAVERNGCQQNGYLLGTWPTGPTLGSPSVLGPSFWGTVLTWPCKSPPTPTSGNSFSIGADWWSDNGAW